MRIFYALIPVLLAAGDPPGDILLSTTAASPPSLAGVHWVADLTRHASAADLRREFSASERAGYRAVTWQALAGAGEVRALASAHAGLRHFVQLKPEQLDWRIDPALPVVAEALWPGLERRDPTIASATESPWINSNIWQVAWLRAIYPGRPALLALKPDPRGRLDLALLDAQAAGGNSIIPVLPETLSSIESNDSRAVQQWQSLLQSARFLRQAAPLLSAPVSSRVAIVAGRSDMEQEAVNMLFRWNASPAVLSPHSLASTGLSSYKVLIAAKQAPIKTAPGQRLFPCCADDLDPSEFALDVIEALGWQSRDLRLWHANAAIGMLRRTTDRKLAVAIVNYGSPFTDDFLLLVEGAYKKAVLHTPEREAPFELRTARRGSGTEVEAPGLHRIALIVME